MKLATNDQDAFSYGNSRIANFNVHKKRKFGMKKIGELSAYYLLSTNCFHEIELKYKPIIDN